MAVKIGVAMQAIMMICHRSPSRGAADDRRMRRFADTDREGAEEEIVFGITVAAEGKQNTTRVTNFRTFRTSLTPRIAFG